MNRICHIQNIDYSLCEKNHIFLSVNHLSFKFEMEEKNNSHATIFVQQQFKKAMSLQIQLEKNQNIEFKTFQKMQRKSQRGYLSFGDDQIEQSDNRLQMIIGHRVSTRLLQTTTYSFAGLPFGKKREKVKNDLDKYNVVIVGGNLGALLSNHLDTVVQDKAKIFVAWDNPVYQFHPNRPFYEKGSLAKIDMQGSPKNSINKFTASSEGQGVVKYLPNENAVILKNGRRVEYDHLVIATGVKADNNIKGFDEAWADLEHHVYADQDHESWKLSANKSFRYIHNFPGGDAFYYIPPTPFHGELEHYNFFLAKELWDRYDSTGLISWKNSSYTIVNANNSFCEHFSEADAFIKSELERRGINVEYGQKLVEIRKDTNTAVFENIQTGERSERRYANVYSLLEKRADPILKDAGLAASNGLLDVNPNTLQHNRYSNIFGFGDVANLPTTKTFYAGFNQLHVVRHNLEQVLNGAEPNALYDGNTEATLHLGLNSSTTVSHLYDGKANGALDSGFMAGLRYKLADKGKKSIIDLMKFKSWGPPYYKWKKTFDGSKISNAPAPQSMQPDQKSA